MLGNQAHDVDTAEEHARSADCPLSPGALPHHQLRRPGDQGSEEKGEGRKDE